MALLGSSVVGIGGMCRLVEKEGARRPVEGGKSILHKEAVVGRCPE